MSTWPDNGSRSADLGDAAWSLDDGDEHAELAISGHSLQHLEAEMDEGGGNGRPDGSNGRQPGGRGGGGQGGSGSGAGASGGSLGGFISRVWPGWRRRVAADPDFPFKVLMEETVGLGLAASGMIAARGKDILNELDFAFCDVAVGATLNFILVYLLSPVALVPGAAPASGWSKVISTLPANVFAAGSYSLSQRVGGFMYKGLLFGVCGFLGSLVGASISQGLVELRRTMAKRKGGELVEKPFPNLAVTSAAWAGFMFLSSNPRYQTVAGLERALFANVPEAVAKVGCASARTLNNVIGGAIWVWWARALGIQASPKAESD
jgi:hypothetical protein